MSSPIQPMNFPAMSDVRFDMAVAPVKLIERIKAARDNKTSERTDTEDPSSALLTGEGLLLMQRSAREAGGRGLGARIGSTASSTETRPQQRVAGEGEQTNGARAQLPHDAKRLQSIAGRLVTSAASVTTGAGGQRPGPVAASPVGMSGPGAPGQGRSAPTIVEPGPAAGVVGGSAEPGPAAGAPGGSTIQRAPDPAVPPSSASRHPVGQPVITSSHAAGAPPEAMASSRIPGRDPATSMSAGKMHDRDVPSPVLGAAMPPAARSGGTSVAPENSRAPATKRPAAVAPEGARRAEATVTVPFTSWGPEHHVVASWTSGAVPGAPGQAVTLRGSTDKVADAVEAALVPSNGSGQGDREVQPLDTADDSHADGRRRRRQAEDEE